MMGVLVDFLTNMSDERHIHKATNNVKLNVDCDIYDPTDRINPVFIIQNTNFNISTCNYMHVPAFGRYYFITSIEGDAAKRLYVHGHVDVLQSFENEIRACDCIAARSSSDYNFYLQDNARLFNTYTWNQYIDIMDIGSPDTLIITTV